MDPDTGAALCMPDSLVLSPYAAQAWHLVMDNQSRFRTQELPLIEQYCIAYAISRQAVDNLANGDGTIQTSILSSSGNPTQNPEFKTWKEAVNQMRQLSGVLGLDTLTAERLKLTKVAASSLAADIPHKIFASMAAAKEAGIG